MRYITRWYWDFGDGEHSLEQNPYHVYKTPGLYTVTLTVTDSRGNTASYIRDQYVAVFCHNGFIHNLSNNLLRKSYNLALKEAQGGGWSENSGDGWVWPESPAAILNIVHLDKHFKLVFDEKTGCAYTINLRPSEHSTIQEQFVDKYATPGITSGYSIPCSIKLREQVGDSRVYKIKHEETFLDIRPNDVNSGHEDGQSFDVTLYADGEAVGLETLTDINTSKEQLFTKKYEGDTVQVELESDESGFVLSKVESTMRAQDRARYASTVASTENSYAVELSSPVAWLTRGSDNDVSTSGYLFDRVSKTIVAGDVDSGAIIVGPDGRDGSGCNVVDDIEIGNSLIGTGTMLVWCADGYEIDGVALTQVGSVVTQGSISWVLNKYKGEIPAAVVLAVDGDPTPIYDFRLYNTTISDAAILHYYNSVVNDEGKGYLPVF